MARSFNGTSDVLNGTCIVDGLSAFTLAAWIIHSSGTYAIDVPFDITGSNGLDLSHDGTGFKAGLKTSSDAHGQTAAVAVDGAYHHWAITYDKSDANSVGLELWKDAVSAAALVRTLNSTVDANANALYLGKFGTFGAHWAGTLAEVAIWSVRLTGLELADLTNKVKRPDQIQAASLIGYWPVCGVASPEPEFTSSALADDLTVSGTLVAAHPLSVPTPCSARFFLSPG